MFTSLCQRTNLIATTLNDSGAVSAKKMRKLADGLLDLAQFPPQIIIACLEGVLKIDSVLHWGFSFFSGKSSLSDEEQDVVCQWGRTRGAFAKILARARIEPGMDAAEGAVLATSAGVVNAELAAAKSLFTQQSCSAALQLAFSGPVIGSEVLPAGIFIKIMGDGVLGQSALRRFLSSVSGSLLDLLMLGLLGSDLCRSFVEGKGRWEKVNALHGACDWEDPRNATGEAFLFVCRKALKEINLKAGGQDISDNFFEVVSRIVFFVCIDWLVGGCGTNFNAINYDDSFTLEILDFLPLALRHPSVLARVGVIFKEYMAAQDGCEIVGMVNVCDEGGVVMIVAALLHAASGRAPPWALEYIPPSFEGIFHGIGKNYDVMAKIVETATSAGSKWVTKHGSKPLGGNYVSRLKPPARADLFRCLAECCSSGGWKNFKSGLKMACGRKKKNTTFRLKPGRRDFENERI